MKNLKNKLILTLALALTITTSYSQSSKKPSSGFSPADQILGGMTCVMVQHNVADFDTWESAYKKDRKRRKESGITEKLVLRGTEDANSVTAVFELEDLKKGEAFFADPLSAQLMGAAGVTSKPTFTYFKVSNSGIPTGESFLIIQHTVKNYDDWKQAFDKHQEVRVDYKISLTALGKGLDNALNVVAIFNTDDTNNITSFLEKSDLKDAMKNAGITSEPIQEIAVRSKK
ncbi:MAG: hypothetical protein RIE86_10875 [Imperialibacter sp.]|uniref:hypothetical protein n=1 Tax=Imperialibacter sp. TaxID=2038411 RepID=UPI0032EE0F7A